MDSGGFIGNSDGFIGNSKEGIAKRGKRREGGRI